MKKCLSTGVALMQFFDTEYHVGMDHEISVQVLEGRMAERARELIGNLAMRGMW